MSVELTGQVSEQFEWRRLRTAFELTGEGRLTRLAVEFGDGWHASDEPTESAGADFRHDAGVLGSVRVSSGPRVRIHVTLSSDSSDVVTVPGPVLRVEGWQEPVSWLGEASAEIVLPSAEGPGLLTQRRGISSDGPERGTAYVLEAEPMLRPGQLLSATWTYEAMSGDVLDVPPEPSWFPIERYPLVGDWVELSVPDGVVTPDEGCLVEELDGEYEIYPPAGLTKIAVWGPAGRTWFEIGGRYEIADLRTLLMEERTVSDTWAYVAARHMAETWVPDELVDRLDYVLGQLSDAPTAWSAAAASIATTVGLPLAGQAQETATAVLAKPQPDDVIILAMHGLVPIELSDGGWPLGSFEQMGMEAMARVGYGRIQSNPEPLRGRDVAVAKLFAAGLGEAEQGLRASAYAMAAEHRLLASLAAQPSADDLAWVSLG